MPVCDKEILPLCPSCGKACIERSKIMVTTEETKITETKVEGEGEHSHTHRHRRHIYYRPEIEKMRLLLMACSILYTYGIYLLLGDINNALFGFSFPALYIISGYLVLRKSENIEKRILRTVGRTAICLVILFAVYLGLSLLAEWDTTVTAITSKAFWVNFFLLGDFNLPIGFPIWYVQALLYAYIIIYAIYKLKLLKFDIYIAALCLIVTVLTGELAGVIGFNFFGHTYISGNFFTRALPYILIGCFIHRKKNFFADLKTKHFCIIILAGFVLSVAEYILLSVTGTKVYVSHLLGMGLVAVAVCVFVFNSSGLRIRSEALQLLSRYELMIPFFISSPIYYFLVKFVQSQNEQSVYEIAAFIGIIVAVLSFMVLFIYAYIRRIFIENKLNREHINAVLSYESKSKSNGSEESSKTNTPE